MIRLLKTMNRMQLLAAGAVLLLAVLGAGYGICSLRSRCSRSGSCLKTCSWTSWSRIACCS